jgi:predicted transcriptional regulator YdeE
MVDGRRAGKMGAGVRTKVVFPVCCLLSTVYLPLSGGTFKPRIVEESAFSVIGIEARTNNAREMTPDGVIPKQWGRFFKESILEKIPNRTDADILAIYTDYASDRKGDYTFILGARVSDAAVVPPGMVGKRILRARYAVLTTESGPVGKVVSEAWQEIWRLEDHSGLGGRRAYRTDFEVYDQRSRDPQNSQVDIYVGIE